MDEKYIDGSELVRTGNTDAYAWAKSLIGTAKDNNFIIDEEVLMGWFANAMMTVRDNL